MIEEWKEKAKEALTALYNWSENGVSIFHHNDTDGLSSGAILQEAFERKGYRVKRVCLEKPYPLLLKKVFKNQGKILIFADFAGRIAPMLSDLNRSRNLVLILDHHVAEPSTDPVVYNLDPDLFGLKGDRDISASATCYLFSKLMDEKNQDLAWLGALGAVGDEFFVDGKLLSQNLDVLKEAEKNGRVRVVNKEIEGKRYLFETSRGFITGVSFENYLDTLGGAGYYNNGPDIGLKVCLNGFSEESDRIVDQLESIEERAFNKEIKRLKTEGFSETLNIQWFSVANRFSPMGVKMIGAFCDRIKNMGFVNPKKYIAGFQIIPDKIPGFGKIEFNEVKISMRVSSLLEKKIREKKAMGLNILLPQATARLGGFSDACHSLTAATTVKIGKEKN